jgi:hypothetical protein
MATIVTLANTAGDSRRVKVGFAWTAFFFGGFPYFFRGMHKQGFMYVGALFVFMLLVAAGTDEQAAVLIKAWALIVGLVLGFKMNRQMGKDLIERGYTIKGAGWEYAAQKWDL